MSGFASAWRQTAKPIGNAGARRFRLGELRRGRDALGQSRTFSAAANRRFMDSPICGKPYVWRAASSRNLYRPSPWQGNDAFEARLVVLEPQFAAMQARDRRGEAQAKPGTRLRAALLQPHEALDDAAAVGFRNARSAVGDGEQNAVALGQCAHHDLGWCAVDRLATRRRVFDGIVDQIGERLADQFAIAVERRGRSRLDLKRDALFVGQRLVEFADVVRDLGGVELGSYRRVPARIPRARSSAAR